MCASHPNRLRALATRLSKTILRNAEAAREQLGPLQRECVYQRALYEELQADNYTCSMEAPVPVVYTIERNGEPQRNITLAHERADILVHEEGRLYVIEIKRGNALEEGFAQALRYSQNLQAAGHTVAAVFSVAFPKIYKTAGVLFKWRHTGT